MRANWRLSAFLLLEISIKNGSRDPSYAIGWNEDK
jgi:hypothetical protein